GGTLRPLACAHCNGRRLRAGRPGITRVREDLAALLPRTEVAAVDTTTDEMPDAAVLIGTEAVLHRMTGPAESGRAESGSAESGSAESGSVGLVAYLELDQELLAPRAYAAEQALWLLV